MDGAEDFALLGRLEEDYEARRAGEVEVGGGVEVDEAAAGVFTAGYGGASGVGGEGGDKGCLRRDGSGDAAFEAAVGSFQINNRESNLGLGGGLAGGGNELSLTMNDGLGV